MRFIEQMDKLKQTINDYLYRLNHGMRSHVVQRYPQDTFDELRQSYQPPMVYKNKIRTHVILFVITFFTTTWAWPLGGLTLEALFFKPELLFKPETIIAGLPYSLTLLAILLSHEFGHYFAARHFGVQATLPFFIPLPTLIGTMGAVIKTKSPIPHRRALFYIGAMGPIPGFILSLVVVIYGVKVSSIQALPPVTGDGMMLIFGDSLLFSLIVKIIHGTIPPGYDVFLSPYAWAGWIGFLITGLNLMPLGQLDGAHVLYALIGKKQKIAGWTALAALVGLSFLWYGWIVWIILTLAVLMVAHPFVPVDHELTVFEKALGWFCMAILVMTFIPVPVEMM